MLSRSLLDTHKSDAVLGAGFRVATGGNFIVVGAPDGSVSCYSTGAAQFNRAKAPLWTLTKHTAAVTCVVVSPSSNCAYSCSRDGHVVVYQNMDNPAQARSKDLLNVTGELNSIALSQDGRRLFLAGDSVRCFLVDVRKIMTVPMTVPHPVQAVAASPCGNYVAMASFDGSVGVVSVHETMAAMGTFCDPAPLSPTLVLRSAFKGLIPRRRTSDQSTALRLSWSLTINGEAPTAAATAATPGRLMLFVPVEDGVEVLALQEDFAAKLSLSAAAGSSSTQPPPPSSSAPSLPVIGAGFMRSLGRMQPTGLTIAHVTGVFAHSVSKHKVEFVACFRNTSRVFCFRADEGKKWKEALQGAMDAAQGHGQESNSDRHAQDAAAAPSQPAAVQDISLDPVSGLLAAVTAGGTLCIQKSFSKARSVGSSGGGTKAAASQSLKDVMDVDNNNEEEHDDDTAAPLLRQDTQLNIIPSLGGAPPTAMHSNKTTTAPTNHQSNNISNKTKSTGGHRSSDDDDDDSAGSSFIASSSDDDDAEDVAATARDLIADTPGFTSDKRALRQQARARRKEAKRNARIDAKYAPHTVPEFLDNEAEETDSEEDEDDGDGDNGSGGGGSHKDSNAGEESEDSFDDDPREEARRVDAMYRERYGMRDKKKPRHHSHGDDDDDANDVRSRRHRRRTDEDDDDAMPNDADSDWGGADGGDDYVADGHGYGATTMHGATAPASVSFYSFQAGSTPFPSEHEHEAETAEAPSDDPNTLPPPPRSRYLAFNAVGALSVTDGQHIVVQFHDMTKPSARIPERRPVLMGAVGAFGYAVIVGTGGEGGVDGEEDQDGDEAGGSRHPAAGIASGGNQRTQTIVHRAFRSLGMQSEWAVTLPAGERVRNVAVGSRYVATFTNHYLRVFSVSGLELAVLGLTDAAVACAIGFNTPTLAAKDAAADWLAIAAFDHAGALSVRVVDVADDGRVVLPPTPIPLSRSQSTSAVAATLQWMGWSDDGVLHIRDSAGLVSRMTTGWGRAWVPVYDPQHRSSGGAAERFWLWGIGPDSLLACGNHLTANGHPRVTDTLPTVDRVKLCLPLLRSNGDKHMLVRERFLRDYVRTGDAKRSATVYDAALAAHDIALDKALMAQFEAAVVDGRSTRAIDIATMFQLVGSVENAARFANDRQDRTVTTKVLALMQLRQKTRRRRVCPLPLESDLTDRERDRLLRRLLVLDRDGLLPAAGGPAGAAAAAAVEPTATQAPSPRSSTELLLKPPPPLSSSPAVANRSSPAKPADRTGAQSTKASPPSETARKVVFDDAAAADASAKGRASPSGNPHKHESPAKKSPAAISLSSTTKAADRSPSGPSTASPNHTVSDAGTAAKKKAENPFAKSKVAPPTAGATIAGTAPPTGATLLHRLGSAAAAGATASSMPPPPPVVATTTGSHGHDGAPSSQAWHAHTSSERATTSPPMENHLAGSAMPVSPAKKQARIESVMHTAAVASLSPRKSMASSGVGGSSSPSNRFMISKDVGFSAPPPPHTQQHLSAAPAPVFRDLPVAAPAATAAIDPFGPSSLSQPANGHAAFFGAGSLTSGGGANDTFEDDTPQPPSDALRRVLEKRMRDDDDDDQAIKLSI